MTPATEKRIRTLIGIIASYVGRDEAALVSRDLARNALAALDAEPKTVPMQMLMDLAFMSEKAVGETCASFCARIAKAYGYTTTEAQP